MSGRLDRIRAVFVEPLAEESRVATGGAAPVARAEWAGDLTMTAVAASPRVALAAAAWGPMRAATPARPPAPVIVVLCAPQRCLAAAAAVGMAIARVLSAPCSIAAVVGAVGAPPATGLRTPAVGRATAVLRARGQHAGGSGRLVWLPDRRIEAPAGVVAGDPVGAVAAASADLGRAVAATGIPGVLTIPLIRSDALDRVIAWHDGVVVVREPDATVPIAEHVAESLAALGRPVVCTTPSSRRATMLAELGLRAPLSAVRAVERLGLA